MEENSLVIVLGFYFFPAVYGARGPAIHAFARLIVHACKTATVVFEGISQLRECSDKAVVCCIAS